MATVKTVNSLEQIDIAADIKRDIDTSLNDDNLKKVEQKALEGMDEIKNRETQRGNSPAKGGRWNNVYNRQYARRKKNGRRSPVTLRQRRERIEQTQIVSGRSGSKLTFRDGKMAQIFYLHDTGKAKGRKYRQVYPDSDKQVPEEVDTIVDSEIFRILNR